jgi:hypothetical protein
VLLQKRFVLDEDTQPPRIRAAQGHSVQLSQPILEPVTRSSQVPLALHVTSTDAWSTIQQSGELRRMSRTHIHFATGAVHMRANSWATIILKLDLGAALAAGHAFFLSANQVLLCEGPLPVSFVSLVQLGDLPEDWQQEMVASKPQFKRHKGRGGRGGGGDGRQGQQQEKPAGKEQQRHQKQEKAGTQQQEQAQPAGVQQQQQQKQAAATAAGAAAAAAAAAALKGPTKGAAEQY